MAAATTVSLVNYLREYRLLEPAQLDEVTGGLQDRFPNRKALMGELIERGWVTEYQANQLTQGRGKELLLGSYVLLDKVGEGGMGAVFKARNWKLGRVVAVKVIRPDRLGNPDAARRFLREVRAAAALDHPNVVRALDADEAGGALLLAMEYVEGATDLAVLVRKQGTLSVSAARDYIRQVALGLQHAHEKGMVHRDVKPSNLLLSADKKTVKVLDMGLARLDSPSADGEASSTVTQEGAVMGTPDYIAPEQALQSHTVDIRADLYSLGCTFYYLLTGRVPFPGGTLLQKLNRVQNEEPLSVESFRPDVPTGIARVVRKLMAKDPADRYQTPAELVAALDRPPDEDDRTTQRARRAAAPARPADDTAPSPFADLRTDEQPPPQKVEGGRRLLLGVLGGCGVFIAVVGVLFLLLREPGPRAGNQAADAAPARTAAEQEEDAWAAQVAAAPAAKQVEMVAARLKERNPGFDGKVTPKVDDGVVTELAFCTDEVSDISPVRALPGLTQLSCAGSAPGKGRLVRLSPLRGMNLTRLMCPHTEVADLTPLQGMLLTHLACEGTKVADLSPLKGMPLTYLACEHSQVKDLSPLAGMPLTYLDCGNTKVASLAPLSGMPLTVLFCNGTSVNNLSTLKGMSLTLLSCQETEVADLSALKAMRLTKLYCNNTKVFDLSPVAGMPLQEIVCDFQPERDAETLRGIATLEKINGEPAKEFWKKLDDGKP